MVFGGWVGDGGSALYEHLVMLMEKSCQLHAPALPSWQTAPSPH